MNWISKFVSVRKNLARLLVFLLALVVGSVAYWTSLVNQENSHLESLLTASERCTIEILSETLNSNLTGAVAVLGLIDPNVKKEALSQLEANNPTVFPLLESIGRSYEAEGVFIVARNGIISSSWDRAGKPSTNLDVNFRPYFKIAMTGNENIYAAVSLARGDRSIYFSSPIYKETLKNSEPIGAIVARTNLSKIDRLLQNKSDVVLLVSPQGVVFASTESNYIGKLTGIVTPERLKAIKALKQFGKQFESGDVGTVPFPTTTGVFRTEGQRLAVAESAIKWNDTGGDWKLVFIEDLNRTVPPLYSMGIGFFACVTSLFIGFILLSTLCAQYHQRVANEKLETFSRIQSEMAENKIRLAEAGVQLQKSKTLEALLQIFLKKTHDIFGTLQGVIYLCDDSDGTHLQLFGSYACEELPSSRIELGEGLLGQCAIERRVLLMKAGSEGLGMIRSGLGDHLPECVYIAPILLDEKLLGVIEVALLKTLSENEMNAFFELLTILAMNVEIVGQNAHTEALLSAMQTVEKGTQEQLKFQQALIDTIPYPVFYKDADSRFIGVNKAYEESFGVQREMLIGKRIIDLDLSYISERDRIVNQTEDEAIIASAGSISREIQLQFADGNLHDILFYAAGFLNSEGQPAGMVGTNIDVTEIKQVKNELKRYLDAEHLNHLVKERDAIESEVVEREVNISIRSHLESPSSDATYEELIEMLNDYCDSLGVAVAIIGIDGNVLAASKWQKVCSEFHRENSESCIRCVESDTEMALKLDEGSEYVVYKCKNGMTDAGAPVVVNGVHLANVFVGQFHSTQPEEAFFRAQAKQFGYEESLYLKAVKKAAIIEDQKIPAILNFLTGFSRLILEHTTKETRS